MNSELKSVYQDFLGNLEEVNILLQSADECSPEDELKYATYNKSAILLLAGKFENFAESIAEQYIFVVNSLRLKTHILPEPLRIQHSFSMINKLPKSNISGQRSTIVKIFADLSNVWHVDAELDSLDIVCKFSYGKHGEKEFKKLFATVGIDDVFNEVKVMVEQESILGEGENDKYEIDIKGTINSITHIRNNILHQNASPSLTTEAIKNYLNELRMFAFELVNYLNSSVASLTKR